MCVVVLCVLALCCAGCASVTRGVDEQIAVASTPSGAQAVVSGSSYPEPCVTPCAITVKRSDDISIAFSKDGYEPQVVTLTKDVSSTGAAGFAGNLLLGGVIGMAVDGANGAALDHKPNPVIVTLQPVAPPPAKPVRRRPAKPVSWYDDRLRLSVIAAN
jgi:hypothetical protein